MDFLILNENEYIWILENLKYDIYVLMHNVTYDIWKLSLPMCNYSVNAHRYNWRTAEISGKIIAPYFFLLWWSKMIIVFSILHICLITSITEQSQYFDIKAARILLYLFKIIFKTWIFYKTKIFYICKIMDIVSHVHYSNFSICVW